MWSIDAHLDDLEAKKVQVEKRIEKFETKQDIKYPSKVIQMLLSLLLVTGKCISLVYQETKMVLRTR